MVCWDTVPVLKQEKTVGSIPTIRKNKWMHVQSNRNLFQRNLIFLKWFVSFSLRNISDVLIYLI